MGLADDPVEPGGDEPLGPAAYDRFYDQLREDVWAVVDDHHLEATYEFEDFRGALEFAYEAGELAEEAWHHPDLTVCWGEAGVTLWTHDVGGLTKADFVLAARFDRAYADHVGD